MSEDRLADWNGTACGSIALIFVTALIAISGISWLMFTSRSSWNQENTPTTTGSEQTNSAAPTRPVSDYEPGREPTYAAPVQPSNPTGATQASFTIDWDKKTGVLRLDASKSTPGYNYVWYFGWSVGKNTGTVPSQNPQMVTMVREDQLTTALSRTISLNLVNDRGQIVGIYRQNLPQ